MLRVTWLFLMLLMFFPFAMFAMRSFAGCILMKPFNIMGVLNVRFHKFPALRDTLILVFVCSCCMFVTFLDTSGNVVGDQLDKCAAARTLLIMLQLKYPTFYMRKL